ncbi:MAG: hypothetical protein AVDCRST_MAG53-1249, partial [uncultured Solirubrobacteraceae bacterium]
CASSTSSTTPTTPRWPPSTRAAAVSPRASRWPRTSSSSTPPMAMSTGRRRSSPMPRGSWKRSALRATTTISTARPTPSTTKTSGA